MMDHDIAATLLSLQGELRELRGETQEFKRQALSRLEAIEQCQRRLPATAVSVAAACVSMAAGLAACAARFAGTGFLTGGRI